ncbi:MAG: magnesium transporter [Erysipelotrichaceae bacterium]|nr:magnesium transporter [Erysipelotrichaceae bacterium]
MEKEELQTLLQELIANKQAKKLKELFESTPTIDIAEALEDETDVKSLLYVIRVIGSEYSADFFTELTSDQQEMIINAFTDKELLTMLENSFADDIVDTLEEMPANLVSRVLKVAPKELRKDINTLLNYEEDTAGSLLTTEYLDMKSSMTVEEVIEEVRKKGKDAETVYTIFIRDSKRTMVGTVDLDDLIFAKKDQTMEDIMNRDFVTCHVNDDQEKIANMFKRYDLNAMAVVNKENKIIGIITIDDVVDIIVEEATEDISMLNQVTPVEDEYLKTPIYKLVLKCVPWIIVLMILQVFSTMILSRFETAIAAFSILSVFTPLIMDAGGNSGNQTTTIIVRSLALDEFDKGDAKKVIWKEFRVALVIAGIIAVFTFGWLMFEMAIGIVSLDNVVEKYSFLNRGTTMVIVASLVSGTLFATIIVSRLIGCLLPFFAKLIKKDPAVMCGPLTTTIVDIVSLLTYFLLWTLVFAPILGI